ncbi:reverse transcriptase domain-containing protein [Tanacetum coccineum]
MIKCQYKRFGKFKKIHVDITLADALILMPKYQKMLKSLLTNKDKLIEIAKTPMNANCSCGNLKKLPKRSRSSIYSKPMSIWNKLGLPDLTSTRMVLELADRTISKPLGIAENVFVKVGKFYFPVDFVILDFVADPRVPLILDGSQDNESIHMMDAYDDRVKDVCEPESNDDSTTSAIVDDFESLLGDIIKQKEELKGISDPVARRRACFAKLDNFKTFSNPLFEKQDNFPSRNDESIHEETFKSYLNPLFEDDEEIISNEASSILSPKIDVKTIMSFFAPIGNCVRKWATSEVEKDNVEVNHEVFKSNNENVLGIHDNEEEEIAFLDGLLEDENFFEMNDKKVESFESKTKEVFETKVEPEKKKELQVFHPDIEILDHLETTSYVGSDYVFYEDFNLVDMIFPMNIQGKIFDPGITFHEKSFEKFDKSSKELAPSKALLTLDVFDPLHPPLMDFNVTKAFFRFTFSILKIISKKFVEPGIKNVLERIEKTKRSKNDQKPTRNGKKTKRKEQDKEISQKSQPDQSNSVKERNKESQRSRIKSMVPKYVKVFKVFKATWSY